MPHATKEQVLRAMRRLHRRYVRQCKRRNIYWELSVEDFHRLTSLPCTYCNKPPAQLSRTYVYNGLDRKNNKQGYTSDNVCACCKECNYLKGDRLSFDEMKVVGQALTTFRNKLKTT